MFSGGNSLSQYLLESRLSGALLALNQSKGRKSSIQCEEGLSFPWEEGMVLCTRACQLGKCDTQGGR